MRVVGWDEFRTLPEGTVFQEIRPNSLGDAGQLNVLGEVYGRTSDFGFAALLPEYNWVSVLGDELARKAGMTEGDPAVIFTPAGFGRDGTHVHDGRLWLVWEREDRERLARWLLVPDRAVAEMNDDPYVLVRVPPSA